MASNVPAPHAMRSGRALNTVAATCNTARAAAGGATCAAVCGDDAAGQCGRRWLGDRTRRRRRRRHRPDGPLLCVEVSEPYPKKLACLRRHSLRYSTVLYSIDQHCCQCVAGGRVLRSNGGTLTLQAPHFAQWDRRSIPFHLLSVAGRPLVVGLLRFFL